VLATTLALMKLYDRGEMRPEYTLEQFFPGLDEAKKHITLKQLLTHTSGFVKWKPFYKELSGRKAIVNKILTDTLEYVPGTKYEYSDLNFILLREIVEKLAGMPIEEFLQKEFYGPLGLYSITYLPKDSNNCIPTEIVSGKVIHGFVQDENAHAMGGISGHAGLFSNAEDIAVIAEMLLNGGVYNGKRYLKKETIEFFRKRRFDRPHWTHALGWDTPSREESLVGDEFPRTSIGHWGFSGTSVWLDFEDDIFVILLTNRTYPDRSNKKIADFRPRLHDALYRELTEDN
jgi:CubicO group peptidase (beta-lactamase class C family)